MRFYVGVPLKPDGEHTVGTLCLFDDQPRSLSEEEENILTNLTHQAEELLRFNQARRELEEQYQQALVSNARYGALIAGAAVGIVRINSEGGIEDANPFLLELLDTSIPALKGMPVNQILSDVWGKDQAEDPMPGPLSQEGCATEARRSDGNEIPVHLTMTRVSLAEDAQHEYMIILTDLTEVHRAREELRKEHAFLRSIIDASSNPIYVKHQDGTYLLANKASETLAGMAGYDRIEGLTSPKLYPEGFAREAEDSATRIMETGSSEILIFDAEDGRHFEISKNPLYDEQGKIEGVVNVAHDVSDHRRLTAQLEERERELERQMAERDRFTEALTQARDEAEEANKAKTRFLSAMSHELRTPLNSILGFAQLLENSQKNPLVEKQARHVGQIRRSGQHLLELINEVLDLARVESGRIQLSMEDIHSGEALEEAMETLSTLADSSGITLSMIGDPKSWPSVRADFTRLKQVLLNLLSNAIKYNRPEGQVLLHFEVTGGNAILHCEDTGMGIAQDKMSQLFEPFDRLGADQGIEGTGIGLALTRRLVHAMEGHLHVESTLYVGSDFQIHLPLAGIHQQRQGQVRNDGSSLEFEGCQEPDRLPRQRILYVEDNPANQRLMQEAFEDRQDLEMICVHNAELGLDMARTQEIDMVLMDINLPGMDGIQALHLMRENERTRNIPIVAISANAMESDVHRGLREGFQDYLTKPVDMMQLFGIIDTHLGNSNN